MPDLAWLPGAPFPPGGFQYRQPETGWAVPNQMLPLDMVIGQVMQHRMNNPQIHRSIDYPDVYRDVLNYNAVRLSYDAKYFLNGPLAQPVMMMAEAPPRPCCGGR